MALPSSMADCEYPADYEARPLSEQLVMARWVSEVIFAPGPCTPLFKWQYAVNLLGVLLWLVLGRWGYDALMRARLRRRERAVVYTLADELTRADNKAQAVDFAAFVFAVCCITHGSLSELAVGGAASDDGGYFAAFFAYQGLGLALILLATYLQDTLTLHAVNPISAIVDDHNVGVAAVRAGATVASAIVIAASASGVSESLGEGLLATVIYWALGQAALLLYCLLADRLLSLRILPNAPRFDTPHGSRAVTPSAEATGQASGAGGSSVSLPAGVPGAPGAIPPQAQGGCGPTAHDGGAGVGALREEDGRAERAAPQLEESASEASDGRALSMPTSLLAQAARGNVAAGVALGCDLVHASILVAAPIRVGFSIVAWAVYVGLMLGLVSPLVHNYLDKVLLRGAACARDHRAAHHAPYALRLSPALACALCEAISLPARPPSPPSQPALPARPATGC
jgi:uncharacterized membrane protein YjfL (UPF0719 family)